MTKIKILTSPYESKMEADINALLSEGYELYGELTTYDKWEYEFNTYHQRTDHRIQVTYFKQLMIKSFEAPDTLVILPLQETSHFSR